jgi:hypothetical protein
MHLFFRDVRVYRRKEFFAATAEDIHRFFDVVEGKDIDDADEYRMLWTSVLQKVK